MASFHTLLNVLPSFQERERERGLASFKLIGMDLEAEASCYETSEISASFVTSTPLLLESWRLSTLANTTLPRNFLSEQIGNIGYIAFSGVQNVAGLDTNSLVPLDCPTTDGHFLPLKKTFDGHGRRRVNGGEVVEQDDPVMVHAGMLHVFMTFCMLPNFQNQVSTLLQNCKSIVVTGHSLGGAIASLTALWLLSYLQTNFLSISVLCITFGSPVLGNESLTQAILCKRWDGNFCHVVSRHDIVPRLLFATPHIMLLQFWQFSMALLHSGIATFQYSDEEIARLFQFVLSYTKIATQGQEGFRGLYIWPFGNYLFCSNEGAVCMDNLSSIVKMLHLMLQTSSPISSIEDHFRYGDYAHKLFLRTLKRRGFMERNIPESNCGASIVLALQPLETYNQGSISEMVKDCLMKAKQRRELPPSLVNANLIVKKTKVLPYMAEIEWYKRNCDQSTNQLGYYDSFKQREASKREFKVDMNRIKLAAFWDNIIRMMEEDALSPNFLKARKWVNAAHTYKLLIEPLDIADYYRTSKHQRKGHYMQNGRARRYEIFDSWWEQREDKKLYKRTKFAGLTQDSCFWAKVEEARDWLSIVRSDPMNLDKLWGRLIYFEKYATNLVDNMEVSKDVMAKNSSYSLWAKDWIALKLQFQQQHVFFSSRCRAMT